MGFSAEVERHLDAIVDASNAFGPVFLGVEGALSLDAQRAIFEDALSSLPIPPVTSAQAFSMGKIAGELVTSDGAEPDRAILMLHGGGFIAGGLRGHRGLAGHFASRFNACVYVPRFRLAPEHPYPAAVEDCLEAYRWLVDDGVDPDSIGFIGNSSGGGLVISTMLLARNLGLPLPAAAVAMAPWVDLENAGSSMTSLASRDRILSNSEGLGLEALGVEIDPMGAIKIDDDYRTNMPSVSAVNLTRSWETTGAS